MKKLIMLMAIAALFTNEIKAQGIQMDNPPGTGTDVYVYLEAVDVSTCNVVGTSNWFYLAAGTSYSFNTSGTPALYPGGFWSTDPTICLCTWQYQTAIVESVCSISGSAATNCPLYDIVFLTAYLAPCSGPYANQSCYTLSTACGSLSSGDDVHVDFADAGGSPTVLHVHHP